LQKYSHTLALQGYIVYAVKNKLKSEYLGLPGDQIKDLKLSGVQVRLVTFNLIRSIYL
jgi:ribonuclease Z